MYKKITWENMNKNSVRFKKIGAECNITNFIILKRRVTRRNNTNTTTKGEQN